MEYKIKNKIKYKKQIHQKLSISDFSLVDRAVNTSTTLSYPPALPQHQRRIRTWTIQAAKGQKKDQHTV